MYLKELEINGFKSFADATSVGFHPGVTVIVGPNGCGKSNVSDALRWVLGEQNARNLRGNRMMDMIFNGTVNRTPEGMAEVSLTFDNSDALLPINFTEVKITRRIYRDGESEYLINGTKCRLKDISDLFLDSGIGLSSYSLMEQGQVDRIVKAKPEERRALIEEAAGVSRYIRRREEALRKLSRTEEDLARVEDILQELDRQARSLKRQASQAERAREYRRSLEILERVHEVRRGHALKSSLQDIQQQLQIFQEQIHTLREELTRIRAQKSGRLEEREKLEAKNREKRDLYVGVTGRIEQGDRNVESLQSRQEEYLQMAERLTGERENAIMRLEDENHQLEVNQQNLTRIKNELVHFFDYLERLEGEFSEIEARLIEVEEEGQNKRHALQDVERELANAETQSREWERDRRFFTQRGEQMAAEASALEHRLQQERSRQTQLTAASQEVKRSLRETVARSRDLEAQLGDVERRHKAATREFQTAEREWNRTESRLDSLVELQRNLEGYGSGVKFLMRRDNGAIEGLMTTLGEVLSAEAGYELAIDSALRDHLQSIVAADTGAVRSAILRLKESKEGRVDFLIDAEFPTAHGVELPPSLHGLERAVDRVHVAEGYERIARRLLSQTLIVEDIDQALELWRDLPNGWQMVTRQGERLDAEGTITGGQATHASLLLRTTEIGELRDTLAMWELRRDVLAEQVKFLSVRVADLAGQREKASRLAVRLEAESRGIHDELNRLAQHIGREETQLQTLLNEKAEIEQHLQTGEQEEQIRAERIHVLEERRIVLQDESQDWDRKIASLTDRRREIHEGISAARMQRLEREKDQERWRAEIENRKNRIAELESQIEKNAELIAQQHERAQQVAAAIAEQKELLIKQRKERDAMLHELERGQAEIDRVKAEIRAIETEEERLVSRIETTDGQRLEVDQKQVRLSVEMEYWERRMNELFGDEPPETIEDERSDAEVEEEITLLRQRLERLGVINELAVEQYEEVNTRLESLTVQKEDLMKARADLLHTIRELHQTTVERFTKTFNDVQTNFKNMVRKMFNGGRAELRLEEGVDPMTAGIEIEVQPPGKKLISISLMSGGEKALVAIALMFAVYQTKPSPFCFLDEIDAPLDDTNISRFTTMLETFLSTSQFIIISHNKKTMEIADTLYGVTMQEEGVSTLMSMQFEVRAHRKEALERRMEYLRRRSAEAEESGRRTLDLESLGRDEPAGDGALGTLEDETDREGITARELETPNLETISNN